MNEHERIVVEEPSPEAPDTGQDPPRRSFRDVITSREVIAALIVGALTVASTIGGAVATNWLEVRQTVTEKSSSELSDDVERLQRQLVAAQDEAAALRDQVAVLEEENANLGGSGSGGVPTDSTSTTEGEALRQADGVAIAAGSCLDLDSDAPNWGVTPDAFGLGFEGADVCYLYDELLLLETVEISDDLDEGEPTTLAACEAQTLVIGDGVGSRWVEAGLRVCGKTDKDRTASVTVTAADEQRLTMDLRVWK